MSRSRFRLTISILSLSAVLVVAAGSFALAGGDESSCGEVARLEGAGVPVAVHFTDASVREVLSALAEIGGFSVSLRGGEGTGPRVSLDLDDVTVAEALAELCRGYEIRYDVPDAETLVARVPAD